MSLLMLGAVVWVAVSLTAIGLGLWMLIREDRAVTNVMVARPPVPEPATTFLVVPLHRLPPVPPSRRDPLADQPANVLRGEALRRRFEHVVSDGWVS